MRKPISRRSLTVVAVLVLAGVLAGAVVAARSGESPPDPLRLQQAIDEGVMVQVADIPAANGQARRGVFAEEVDTGQVCLWDAPAAASKQRQGGCNPIDDPLGGSAISASLAYEGGPAIESVKDARIIGLTSQDVAQVVVVMSDGSERAVALKPAHVGSHDFLAFGFRVRKSDLRSGVGPTAIVARDANGAEIARQPTGIGA
jgi:hypothetical protein